MEKILSDIQLAEVDVRYYEILRDDAMQNSHALACVWQKKVEEAKKALEMVQALDLCEGCHRPEEFCICGGVPDEF